MENIRLCSRCVNPTTRPNVYFNDEGICGVCQLMEKGEAGQIDWELRRKELKEITNWGTANSKNTYDCIVTVSGGKDSTRQALFVKEELGLNPLLVSAVYPPEQLQQRGADNLATLINHGFDCVSLSLNPIVFKDLMRACFRRYGNFFNASEMALYAIPIHVSIAYNIPLVFLGDNPAHTVGEKHGDSLSSDASQTRKSNTLLGGKSEIFLDLGHQKKDLHFYDYPSEEDVKFSGTRIVYLGYYIEDWSAWNNGQFSIEHGLKIRTDAPEHTGDLYGFSALDDDFRIVNQFLKFLKFGFGHVTDQVMDRIHMKKMTREEGLELVKQFDGKCHSKYIDKVCHYLEIDTDEFWEIAEKKRNLELWEKDARGEWVLKHIQRGDL